MLTAAVLAGAATAQDRSVRLEADMELATAGYFQLRWVADSAIELQESPSADFSAARTIYSGSDRARILSGKSDGDWFYRARPAASGGAWSNVVEVTVRHHPLARAIGFFVVGAVVFSATLMLIVSGARRDA